MLTALYKKGYVSRESIDSTLIAYNNSCAEMRSEARDAYIRFLQGEGQIEELLQIITGHMRNLRTD
jgi:hypothetical protein